MKHRRATAGRRLKAITIDQAIAGGSNVLIAVLAARILDVASFGLFGIVFLVYVTVQVSARALVCEPLLVHPEEARERIADVLGTGVVLSIVLALVVALGGIGGYAWDHRLGEAMFVLAGCMPLLAVQDLGRYLGFATQRPGSAVLLDVTWLVLQIAAIAVLVVADAKALTWFIVAWAGSGALSGILVFPLFRGGRPRLGLAWLSTTWMFSWRYLLAALAASGASLVGSFLLGLISGPKALGSVVGANLMVRPFMTFQIAAIAAAVSEIASDDKDRPTVLKHVRRTSGLTTAIGAATLAALLVMPDVLGRLALGDTWERAKPLLLPTGLLVVVMGLITGPRSGLLGMRAVRKAMAIDIAGAVSLLVTTVVGAHLNGALGSVWAVTIGHSCVAATWWFALLTHWRRRQPSPSTENREDQAGLRQ